MGARPTVSEIGEAIESGSDVAVSMLLAAWGDAPDKSRLGIASFHRSVEAMLSGYRRWLSCQELRIEGEPDWVEYATARRKVFDMISAMPAATDDISGVLSMIVKATEGAAETILL